MCYTAKHKVTDREASPWQVTQAQAKNKQNIISKSTQLLLLKESYQSKCYARKAREKVFRKKTPPKEA